VLLALVAWGGCAGTGASSDTAVTCDEPTYEAWDRACAAAWTEADCGGVDLPDLVQVCECDDCGHACGWVPGVQVTWDATAGCAFGDTAWRCVRVGQGEANYGSEPPCGDDPNDNQVFTWQADGSTRLGYAAGGTDLVACDPSDPLCACVCDPAYPVRSL
jgi:hypothetical protein